MKLWNTSSSLVSSAICQIKLLISVNSIISYVWKLFLLEQKALKNEDLALEVSKNGIFYDYVISFISLM